MNNIPIMEIVELFTVSKLFQTIAVIIFISCIYYLLNLYLPSYDYDQTKTKMPDYRNTLKQNKLTKMLSYFFLTLLFAVLLSFIFELNYSHIITIFTSLSLMFAYLFQDLLIAMVSYMIIVITEPYIIGDKIRIKDIIGRVKYINIMNTVILDSVEYRDIIIPNKMILSDTIQNYSSTPEIVSVIKMLLSSNNQSDNLKNAFGIIRTYLSSHPNVIKDKYNISIGFNQTGILLTITFRHKTIHSDIVKGIQTEIYLLISPIITFLDYSYKY